ncbi:MAG: O-antigen ligase family protein [Planctomycetota bacterium]
MDDVTLRDSQGLREETVGRLARWGGALGLMFIVWPWLKHHIWNWGLALTHLDRVCPWLVFPKVQSGSTEHDFFFSLFVALCLLWMALRYRTDHFGRYFFRLSAPARTAMLFLFLFIGWNAVSWLQAPEAVDADFGILRALKIGLATAVALAFLTTETRRRGLLRAMMLSGFLIAFISLGIIGYLHYIKADWRLERWFYFVPGRYIYPFAMPSAFGAIMMAFGLAGLCFLHDSALKRSWWKAVYGAVILGSGLLGLYYSGTRACQLGFVAGLWTVALLHVPERRLRTFAWGSVATGLLIVVLGLGYIYGTPEGRRKLFTDSAGTRILFAESAVKMGFSRPLAGWGPSSYPHGAPYNQRPEATLHAQHGAWVRDGHCEPAQVFGELGLVGLVIWTVLQAAAFLASWGPARSRIFSEGEERRTFGFSGTVLVMFIALFVEGLVSPAQRREELGWLVPVVLGMAIAPGWSNPARGGPFKNLPRPADIAVRLLVVLLSLFLAANAYGGLLSQVDLYESFGWTRKKNRNNRAVEAAARRAVSRTTNIDAWQRAAGLLADSLIAQANDLQKENQERGLPRETPEAAAKLDEAMEVYERIAEAVPSIEANYHSLVPLEERRTGFRGAFRVLLKGLRFRPYSYSLRGRLRQYLSAVPAKELDSWRELKSIPGVAPAEFDRMRDEDWEMLVYMWCYLHGKREDTLEAMKEFDGGAVRVVPFASEYGVMLYETGRKA